MEMDIINIQRTQLITNAIKNILLNPPETFINSFSDSFSDSSYTITYKYKNILSNLGGMKTIEFTS